MFEPDTCVRLKERGSDEFSTRLLDGWRKAYAHLEPFFVHQHPDSEHVSIRGADGQIIHFGSVECPLLHISFIEVV